MNPHLFARDHRNCYTRATIMAIAGCLNAFADAEFTLSSADANARARTLYKTALDLLDLPEAAPETGADVPFPLNPVWESMRGHSRSGLNKIHRGLNIAGVPTPGSGFETILPSQYRYGVLVERAKNLVGIAQQVEGAYLSALEQRDAKTYDSLRAGHDLEVAGSTVVMQIVKVFDADVGVRQAELQRERAQMQDDHYDKLISDGYSRWEQAGLAAQAIALYLHAAAGVAGAVAGTVKSAFTFGIGGSSDIAQSLSAFAASASAGGQLAQTLASYERREQDWQLQRGLARKDVEIGRQQVAHAYIQRQLAEQDKGLAQLQMAHAEAVAVFLATRFTNAELFEWMSAVLGRVYAFFLQQATALALLAEAQLAFERQELLIGFVGSDYWRDATAGTSAPDRRGLTGSARLLQDVTRLDQYAFDTDRRKLHLTQTFPLSQIAEFELQQFLETGVLTFATPQELFDREFPGHYLRLIKRVRLSVVALIPPVRGVRATLSASGVSRTVVTRGPFDTVTLRRQPESIAFTSPTNATGLFELEPESGLLLPFEGLGVDTVWQLALPKAANPFDYRNIADVLFTIEYTALDSADYRERVVRELDRRYSADRSFSVRNRFPDAWYGVNNPENVEPDRRVREVLPLRVQDFPPHIHDLRVAHLTVFVVRRDELADELTFTSLRHTVGSQAVATDEVSTTGGIASTRRPSGTAWGILLGMEPAGEWELAVRDDPLVRSWFTDGRIEDVVLVLTLSGTTPAWP